MTRITLLICLLLCSSVHAAKPKGKRKVVDIGSRRELFVDDLLIGKLKNARRQLHHPVARNIAVKHEAAWEGAGCGYHSMIKDGDIYRMYYRGSKLAVKNGKLMTGREVYCYAESKDGVTFTKPNLGLYSYKGSKKNNIIWMGVGTHNFAPFLDTRKGCPKSERFKALGGLASQGGLFAFKSGDGIHWSLMRKKPVVTVGAFDSQNLAFWDETIGMYRCYFRTFTKGITTGKVWKPAGYRAIRTAVSKDFLSWVSYKDLTYKDSPTEHMYTNQVAPYARAPHILLGFPTRYVERGWSRSMRKLPELKKRKQRAAGHLRYGTSLTEALVMASRDGVKFERWNEAFVRPGPQRPDTWNYGHQYLAWRPVITKSSLPGASNELSFYGSEGGWHGKGNAMRRYTIRLDGFVSITASLKGGEMTTRPITFNGSKLFLNFATSATGGIRVEIQDGSGKAIPGFSLKESEVVFGDTVRRQVTWKSDASLKSLAGKVVRLRFEIKDADLYSMKFGN